MISADIQNATLFPDIHQIAEVRRGLDLAPQELAFLAQRKLHVRDNFGKHMGVDPSEVILMTFPSWLLVVAVVVSEP